MFERFRRNAIEPVDSLIDTVQNEMHNLDVDAEEYSRRLGYLERLYELKTKGRRQAINPDTIVMVLGNLAGILTIVGYERVHVVTSKAFNHIGRAKDLK